MRRTTIVTIVIAATLASLFAGCATCPRADLWEYRVIEATASNPQVAEEKRLESLLNDAAQEGYMIVLSDTVLRDADGYSVTVVILKRRRK